MAYRLGDYVVYGELWNTSHYGTHASIALLGETFDADYILRIELTGNCAPDLRGKHIRFQPEEDGSDRPVFRIEEHGKFQQFQIGPTGTMTAQGWVRTMPCPVEEFMRRTELGEAPPTPWKRRLYLEWYSQNGRVVIEMAGAVVEECVRESQGEGDEGEWKELPNLALPPGATETGLGVTLIELDGDDVHVEKWMPSADERSADGGKSIPGSLQHALDAEAAALDRAIVGENEFGDDNDMREIEWIDYCIDHCDGEPIASLLGNAADLPPPETLNDKEVESALKGVLARMALIGVALDACNHFTPRDCYRLLRDEILPKSKVYEEMIGTGWMQHVSTWEYCSACEAECDNAAPGAKNQE